MVGNVRPLADNVLPVLRAKDQSCRVSFHVYTRRSPSCLVKSLFRSFKNSGRFVCLASTGFLFSECSTSDKSPVHISADVFSVCELPVLVSFEEQMFFILMKCNRYIFSFIIVGAFCVIFKGALPQP